MSDRRDVRPSTTQPRDISLASLAIGRACYPVREWAKLLASMGPCRLDLREHGWCPHVGCRHHLYLDVNPAVGSIKFNFPDIEPWEMEETCALEVAERGGARLVDVGRAMNLTRERARQIERSALDHCKSLVSSDLRGELLEADAMRVGDDAQLDLPRHRAMDDPMVVAFDAPEVGEDRRGEPGQQHIDGLIDAIDLGVRHA